MRSRSVLSRAIVAAVALAPLLAATGCGDDGETLTVYSGRTEDLVGPLIKQFTDETGIKVSVKYGQSADLALLLDEELAAGKSDVDVFISQSPGAMGFLDANGRLAEIDAGARNLVPESVRDDDNRWIGMSGRQRVLVYNTDLVDPSTLPDSVSDLTDPSWKGKIGVAPSNGSFQDFVTAMRVSEGDDATQTWLSGLAANDPVTFENNNAIVEAVARGEVEVGLVNHYYNYRRLAETPDSPTANHYFAADDPGSVLIVTAAAVVDGAAERSQADQFVAWLLAEKAQRYFADETFEYPLASGVEPSGDVPASDFQDVGGIDFNELGGGLEGTRAMIAEAGLAG
jgi:iron(III) transport system substrate-binding protein